MSDTESVYVEDELSSDRELIAVVRVNRFLYDKTQKLYVNGDVKTAAWTQIGASLSHPVEGPAAEKRFNALRQRFGKERRKVVQSMPRSGAGADQPTYTPTWTLYKDLTFLEDIIKPRKTSSNYKSKAPANNQVPFHTNSPSAPSGGQVTMLCTIPSFSVTSATASPDTSSSWNWDLYTKLGGTDESSTDISEGYPCSSPSATPSPVTSPLGTLPATLPSTNVRPATLPSATQPAKLSSATPPAISPSVVTSGSESNNAVAQVKMAMSKIGAKRTVPLPDSFATKKRQEIDTINKTFIEQSKGLTELATKIGQAITAPPPPPSTPSAVISNVSSSIQSMLNVIGVALDAVPEHAQLECLIGILQHINSFSKIRVNKPNEAND